MGKSPNVFHVHALDTEFGLRERAITSQVPGAAEDHILGVGALIGLCRR